MLYYLKSVLVSLFEPSSSTKSSKLWYGLSSELTDVREREQAISEQSRKAKEELKNSLIDSEKNAR